MKRFATIDIGTNSALLHVAERDPRGHFHALDDRIEICRLGEGLRDRGELTPAAIDRTVAVLARFRSVARELGATELAAVGTMGLRSASNAAVFLERAARESGVEVTVISGEEEARLSFRAVAATRESADERLVVLDIGGGSTELIVGSSAGEVERWASLPIGAVRLTEEHLRRDPPAPDERRAAFEHAREALRAVPRDGAPDVLFGVGGTVTTMAAVHHGLRTYIPAVIAGTSLDRREVERQIQVYASRTLAERRLVPGLPEKRADVILAGALIVAATMDHLASRALRVTDRGVRHGLLLERFG